jgi:TP901 family phage tail tape measure protein
MAFTIPTIFTAIDKMTSPVEKMAKSLGLIGQEADTAMARVDRRFGKLADVSAEWSAKSAIAGAAIVAPLALAANEAIKFEDKMADVAKTTGLSGEGLRRYGEDLLKLSGTTRTSIDDLVKISEIGGQLGIAQADLLSFTTSVDKFNVAIGADFAGGAEEAATQVGKIKSLFAETQGLNIADAINKTGSAINELGAVGAGTSANITDFALRMGQLPAALRPSLQDALALGTFLEEAGIDSQVASGGLTRFFLVAGSDVAGFAKQMHSTTERAKELLATKPAEFAKQFASSLEGLRPDELAKVLGKLGIGTQESIKVLGALGTNIERVMELQKVSNTSFEQGTSLQSEFEKKNATTAASIAKAKNNLQALAIIVGNEVIPLVTKLLSKITPIVSGLIEWARNNRGLVKTFITVAAVLAGFAFTVSGVLAVVALVSNAILAWSAITKAYIAVQWALNAAMTANPIGLLSAGIVLLIAVIAIVIAKYDEWGASLTFVLGPLGMIINLIMAFKRNWDNITKAFEEKGIIAGLLAISNTITDSMLYPLQQVLEIVGKLTGAEWASNAAASINAFRSQLGVDMADAKGETQAVNPQEERNQGFLEMIKESKQSATLNILDKTGRAQMDNNNIDWIKLSSTQ